MQGSAVDPSAVLSWRAGWLGRVAGVAGVSMIG